MVSPERKQFLADQRRRRAGVERGIRAALESSFPGGIPDEVLEAVCAVPLALVQEVGRLEKVCREMHDGIHLIAEGAAERFLEGHRTCAGQVREHAATLKLKSQVVDFLLQDHLRSAETERKMRENQVH